MEKRKRWHLWLIVCVLALTLYNILPTVFFYAQPLDKPIGTESAHKVSEQIAQRVNSLEGQSVEWVAAFSKNLGVKPSSIEVSAANPALIEVSFKKAGDAELFKKFLPRAGTLIPFSPSQLSLGPQTLSSSPTTVVVRRQLSTEIAPADLNKYFTFSEKRSANGEITPLYKELVSDRVAEIGAAVGGESVPAQLLNMPNASKQTDLFVHLAQQINDYARAFGVDSPITKRFYASFSQTSSPTRSQLISTLAEGLEQAKTSVTGRDLASVEKALGILGEHRSLFEAGQPPLKESTLAAALEKDGQVSLGDHNPFIASISVDWAEDQALLTLHEDVQKLRQEEGGSEAASFRSEKLEQLLVNEIAFLSQRAKESIVPDTEAFTVALSNLSGSQSFLTLDLAAIAEQKMDQLQRLLDGAWKPSHTDLKRENFPIVDQEAYKKLPVDQQQLALVLYAPVLEEDVIPGFRKNVIYVIARGVNDIALKYREAPKGDEQNQLGQDFQSLQQLLSESGFIGYSGGAYGMGSDYKDDYIFELDDYYADLLMATREKFSVHGSDRYAVLEFTDGKQRLLTLNEIETQQQEDLIKWRDDYQAAQVDLNLHAKFDVPPPTKSVVLSNLKLSAKKYFRGDERKVLNWGLDLSGGKTVTVGLRDANNRPVTDPADLNQAVNELSNRVNKMGVSEVEIRQEGNNVVLNFPGAQGWSASELIKASKMTFHIVNEQFSTGNAAVASSVNRFLQDVWNEAVVTNRKDAESINLIAWKQLGGGERPRSEAAQTLYEAGLRLANPEVTVKSGTFDDTLSMIAVFRGNDYAQWQGQSTPLLIVFNNYALEGANLEGVHSEYDPSKGNVLVFGVKGSATATDGYKFNPRQEFHTWTSQFAEDRIGGTPKETYSNGRGWRMAAILNDEIISAPALNQALRGHAQVSGNFSQREINELVADLKAGSLTFTPRILSEKNVSPELGQQERTQGILATAIGFLLVVLAMTWYYRFAGIVASIAVLFNLLIMWGVLQNLDAALTLPGIAGIILTVGMAVDANVLVFERIREEFKNTGRIASAIGIGYRKAFSAIIDSNITTILAAFILMHFDAGPIKAFAVTLIIGIISSMFTALFMTRFFFAGWVQNPKHKVLNMRNFFKETNFNFLNKAKVAGFLSLAVIIIGGGLLWNQKHTMFGMDFTGGYALTANFEEQVGANYRQQATEGLIAAGVPSGEIQVRELNRPNSLRIQLGIGLEQSGLPFYGMPQDSGEETLYAFQRNPRINWVVEALETAGLRLQPESLASLDSNWTAMSGQFSDAMRNNAIMGLGLALLSILLYITVRFEFKYAVGAIIALAHDLLITVGAMAILHLCGVPLQIDLQVVGALMTIVGYSLNDTIVIFDRIREDGRVYRKLSFRELINHSLNVTLNRTLITSGTTLLVLIALVCFGGMAIFNFSLVMAMGVVFGTFSSLFIASPILLFFHNRELAREEGSKTPRKA